MREIPLIVLLVACGGGGNNDGVFVDGPPLGGSCTEVNDACTGETICVSGSCVVAFPRTYEASAIMLTLRTTDPNGAGWDVGGGAPDPLVEIHVNGTKVAMTSTVQDSFSGNFAGPYAFELVGGANLEFIAYDEDVTANDLAYGCGATPITANLLRSRELMCIGSGATQGNSIRVTVTPRRATRSARAPCASS
jgi:hypothetical protein